MLFIRVGAEEEFERADNSVFFVRVYRRGEVEVEVEYCVGGSAAVGLKKKEPALF